ncbi:Mbov_0398 family ICE element protein [Mycoplasma zalophidermidis]|uniref:Mbov_0398 family ICE element protein n=1 Tax=Mycoplasma zalophidermidis TaxID=398174 RepID=UPI00215C8378|nr:hypothetical protein [Mycoplasma zalophidermidis]MCR8966567.1 hypothetical protein [Mycoplasma zalophidermidis]
MDKEKLDMSKELLLKQYENIALKNELMNQQAELQEKELTQQIEYKDDKASEEKEVKPKKRGRKPKKKAKDEAPKQDNGVQLSFRLYDENDILKFKSFRKTVEVKGQSLSNALSDIVVSFLDEKDKRKVMSSLKVDLFYAFRKAFYASLSPYTANIINQILKVRVENNIINKKLDLLLNALAGGDVSKEIIDNPGSELLVEPKYFEQIRQILNIENDEKGLKTNEKVAKVKRREEIYENYEFNNDTDPEILAEYFDLGK